VEGTKIHSGTWRLGQLFELAIRYLDNRQNLPELLFSPETEVLLEKSMETVVLKDTYKIPKSKEQQAP